MRKIYSIIFIFFLPLLGLCQNKLLSYEYWFNNDYDLRSIEHFTPTSSYELNTNIDAAALTEGLNVFNIRFKDENDAFSTTLTEYFYRTPLTTVSSNRMVVYEYWFNNDYENRVEEAFTPAANQDLLTNIDASALTEGLNVFNIRFKDEKGAFSTTLTEFFYKNPHGGLSSNKIYAYRYRIENENGTPVGQPLGEFTRVNLPEPANPAVINFNMEVRQLPKGNYYFVFETLDSLGFWSLTTSDMFEKTALPIALFEPENDPVCSNIAVRFINQSIDADTCLWNFGDGQTSREWEPEHIFATAGQYEVFLTATDKATGRDSTISQIIVIHPEYHTTARKAICIDSTYRFGTQVISEAGVYDEMFESEFGCDSLVTLTVQTVPGNIGVFDTTFVSQADECFNGFYTITVAGDGNPVVVESGAFANYIAGQSIHFKPGFHARSGSYINAYITTEPWYCDQASQAIVLASPTPEPFTDKSFEIIDFNIENEKLLEQSMKVYPNPNNGIFTLLFNNFENNTQVIIFNTLGQKVYETIVNGATHQVELPNIQRGIYLLKAINSQKHFDRKVLVQ